jgi:ankyrin repeat protein
MRFPKHSLALAALLLPVLAAAQSAGPNLSALIRAGDPEAALAAIKTGADVDARDGDGSTPLHWAVYKVDHAVAEALLKAGADPNVRSNLGAVPLMEAANLADLELVRLLLKHRARVDLANDDGQTALMLAARTSNVQIGEALIKAGADVNAVEKWREQTALMWAVGGRNTAFANLLIRHGADIEARSAVNDWGNQVTNEPRAQYRPAGGQTVLLYAVRSGCVECVQALVKKGVDVDRPNPDGVTPLMAAIDNLRFDIANLLLDEGANPHLHDWWGRTALYNAVDMRSYSNRFLIGAGNLPAEGAAPPSVAEALAMIQRLLAMGADPNVQLNFHRPGRGGNSGRFTDDLLTTGATPLLRAALSFDVESAQLLLDHGALVDLPNVMGVTPLMAAAGLGVSPRDTRGSYGSDAQEKSVRMLQLLVKAGADVNARVTDTSSHTAVIARPSSMTNRQGQTAIFGAINWGWTKVAQFLIDNGAKLDVKDDAGKTVIDALKGGAGGRDLRNSEEMGRLIRAAAGVS